jgi:hypothetical protein
MKPDLVRDLDTIPMTRGQLVQLLVRLYVAEGSSYAKAETNARMQVDATFINMKAGL